MRLRTHMERDEGMERGRKGEGSGRESGKERKAERENGRMDAGQKLNR